jgi:hypothetical protein
MLISNSAKNHKDYIDDLLKEDCKKLTIVSPFLSKNLKVFLAKFNFNNIESIELITTFQPNDPEQLTKPFQIRDFFDYFKEEYPNVKSKVHIDNKLHGKLYFFNYFDKKKLILTSGNFTNNGLINNHEWGVLIEEKIKIENALESIIEDIEYAEISYHQISKACQFAEHYNSNNSDWLKKPNIHCNILDTIYSDIDPSNTDPQYFLKPEGSSESPITIESQEDCSELHHNLHFSKKKPKGVKKGDIVITTAVGAGSLLSYFRVTGALLEATEEQIKAEPWMQRWPWYMEGRNQSVNFGKKWWVHDLKRNNLLKEFLTSFSNTAVTFAGGFSLGTINMGNDKVRITKEFGKFLISKIEEENY